MFNTISVRISAYLWCITMVLILLGLKAHAQSLGDPIVNITFGAGTASRGGPLPADSGSTTYTYNSGTPADGYYTIANSTNGMYNTWWQTTDHTGNAGGYMMIVNASYDPGIFYTRKVVALCGNTKYQFAAWVKNLVSQNQILPNITFSIETTKGVQLGTGSTGNIPTGNQWVQYPFTFNTPATADTIVLKMTNNAPGGIGNDIAIDDITFRPYGAPVAVTFDQSSASTFCAGTSHMVTIDATTTLAGGYAQKLQMLVNNVWTDEGAASTANTFSIASPTAAGVYSYRIVSALAGNVSTSNCVVASNLLTLTVQPLPTAAFTVVANTCLGDSTAFKDLSTGNGGSLKTWLWDFGDGVTSSKQNPSHLYGLPGDYTVRLTATNNTGCASAVSSQTIHISAHPVAAFAYSIPVCVTRAITITDRSTSPDDAITSWLWDYGDGSSTETKTNAQPFQHTYTATGTYPVTLVVTSSKGCTSRKVSSVLISPLPVVNFSVPAICQSDYYANFTDSTTIADNTASGFTYLWSFGDKKASTIDNISALKNPRHHYSDTGRYSVSLTVTSNNGCAVTAPKILTVNGATPIAIIAVLDSLALCSNHEVFLQNRSAVDFGNITKVKLYFDYAGDTSLSVTDNNPYYGKLYRHTYPEFHTPATKNYTLFMKVFSGGVLCYGYTTKVIVLKPTPAITLTAPAAVCQAGGTVQFTATKSSGPDGSGVYLGTGINSISGLFDPLVAGVGTFTIQYIYTPSNTCVDTVTQKIMVNASPTVNAGVDMVVLEGGNNKMKAIATGDSLTYAWAPATYLSSTKILNPTVTPKADITYTLSVTNKEGCTATDDVKVTVLKAPVIPNTFTPNGDGKNDTWAIQYLDSYPGCTVDVFNRNGQKVYWSVGYGTPWDGRYNGFNLPTGTYYYMIDPKHGRGIISGSISIIR